MCFCPDPLSSFKCASCYNGICHSCVTDGEDICIDCASGEYEEDDDEFVLPLAVGPGDNYTALIKCADCEEEAMVDIEVSYYVCGKCTLMRSNNIHEI